MSDDTTHPTSSELRHHTTPTKAQAEHIPTIQRQQTVPQNWWWKYRMMIREAAAEFTGVMLLVIFGSGVNCQVGLSSNTNVSASPKGDYLSVSFGWAVGLALAVWVSAGISGGHVNPAVTLSLAIFRGFPWKKVPVYIVSQLFGGIVGAAIVYANYFHAIDIAEGGRGVRTLATAGYFGTFAADYMTNVSCFFSEFLATAILLLVILAVTDKRNSPPPYGLLPLAIFVLTLGIAACLGMETGFAINPARDFGPRLLTSMVGYGSAVYTFRNHYWIWCPIMAPILGAMAGTCFYDALLFIGEESIFNQSGAQTPGIMDHEADDVV
ncbi:putative aquaporin 4 [Marasmius fiardii PR-910]|nr:putative aquaporin 4 [Marasmius fiardii PR-910]